MTSDYDFAKDAIFESLLTRSFAIEDSDTERVAYFEPAMEGAGQVQPLFEEEDRDIVLHRDAHFAGSFPLMIKAYENEEMSAVLPVDTRQIQRLYTLERQLKKNIAPFLLHAADAQKINAVRKMYRLLKEGSDDPNLEALSALILSEEEADIVAKKTALFGDALIPSLLSLLQNELFYDPLFPGYGLAPVPCALTLGLLKAVEAIPTLFTMLQSDNFEVESAALQALQMIGVPAMQFCIKCLRARPLTNDSEKAALALSAFPPDDTIGSAILDAVKDREVQKREPLISYLLACTEELPIKWHTQLEKLIEETDMPQKVKNEILRQSSSKKKKFPLSKHYDEKTNP